MVTLVVAYNGQKLTPAATEAYHRMAAGYKAAGFGTLVITEGYRPVGDPSDVANSAGVVYQGKNIGIKTQWGFWNRYDRRLPGWTLAAKPGTSIHGNGLAADFGGMVATYGTAGKKWMDAHCGEYGWAAKGNNFSIKESWHYEYVGGGSVSTGTGNGIINTSLGAADVKRLQLALGVNPDGDAGTATCKALQKKIGTAVDGLWGTNSTKALQKFVGVTSDGIWGSGTTAGVRAALNAGKFGQIASTTLNITSILGTDYAKKLQTQLNVTADGIFGTNSCKALQTRVGTNPDGLWGNGSTKALQSFVGTNPDGIWGNGTTAAVKAAIDAKKFAPITATTVELVNITEKLGSDFSKRLQAALGATSDGIFGTDSTKRLQAKVGVTADGLWGTNSTKALQKFLNISVDGIWGSGTTTAVKNGIDKGIFGTVPVASNSYKDWESAIDISFAQTNVDYKALVNAGVKSVTLKVGGADQSAATNRKPAPYKYVDAQFEKHYAGLRAAGVAHIDYYWWQDGITDPKTQADDFWAVIKDKIRPGELAALDYETWGANNPLMTAAQVKIFMDRLKANMTSGTPVFYTYTSQLDSHDMSIIAKDYPLWIAQYGANDGSVGTFPTPKGWASSMIIEWQYTSKKQLPGYSGNLDGDFIEPSARKKYGFVKYTAPVVVVTPPADTKPVETPSEPTETPSAGQDGTSKGNQWVVGTLTTVGLLIAALINYFSQNPS